MEYPLLRLGRRIDTVLLLDRSIAVMEFKTDDPPFGNGARQQIEDYALDLFAFHAESRAHPVVPILIAVQGTPRPANWPFLWHGVTPMLDSSAVMLTAPLPRMSHTE